MLARSFDQVEVQEGLERQYGGRGSKKELRYQLETDVSSEAEFGSGNKIWTWGSGSRHYPDLWRETRREG